MKLYLEKWLKTRIRESRKFMIHKWLYRYHNGEEWFKESLRKNLKMINGGKKK